MNKAARYVSELLPEAGLTDDLSRLNILDENVILEELRVRFNNEKYYTFIGDVVIAVNPNKALSIYNEKDHLQYGSNIAFSKEPHVFWIAQQAFSNQAGTGRDQCILVSGESGTGKTESAKLVIEHLAHMAVAGGNDVSQKILQVSHLLEAFGNAATSLNENSSRFGKYMELFFTKEGHLSGAKISEYMLEKSRLVSRNVGESNFHIFYYMFAGLSQDNLSSCFLDQSGNYRILQNIDGSHFFQRSESKDYQKNYYKQCDVMKAIGFDDEDIANTIRLLAVVLHLTNVKFSDDSDTDGVHIENETPLAIVADLLSLDVELLLTALLFNTVYVRGEKLDCLKNKMQADDGRDALAKTLYSRLFGWVVVKTNDSLKGSDEIRGVSIGVLDMSGFEDLSINGFEQLCINAANERLQHYFNEIMFLTDKDDYDAEGIDTNKVDFEDNQSVIDLLFKKPTGIFCVIDDVSTFATSTDRSLVQKLNKFCLMSDDYIRGPEGSDAFVVRHFAGEVQYQTQGMLERNRDRLSSGLLDCMKSSGDTFIRKLFAVKLSDGGTVSGSAAPRVAPRRETRALVPPGRNSINFKSISRRLSRNSRRYRGHQNAHLKSSNFVSQHFQRSLDDLLAKLYETRPWFIRCLKPNPQNIPGKFQTDIVMKQLKQNGILGVAKIRRDGFAIRMSVHEFCERYRDTCFSTEEDIKATFENCRQILSSAQITDYALGVHKIFLRHWHGPLLRDLVIEKRCEPRQRAMPSEPAEDGRLFEDKALPERKDIDVKYCATAMSSNERVSDSSNEKVSEWMLNSDYNAMMSHSDILLNDSVSKGRSAVPCAWNAKGSLTVQLTQIGEETLKKGNTDLDMRVWDRFQMIPRERTAISNSFGWMKKLFKVFCYVLIFLTVISSAVVNKISVLVMTSSVVKTDTFPNEEAMKTMVIVSIVVPYIGWFIIYSIKSFFGSNSWPSVGILSSIFTIELLHTAGLSMLVFKVLPLVDMVRGLILMSNIFLIPGFFNVISSIRDNSVSGKKRLILCILNALAFVVQLCSVIATSFLGVHFTEKVRAILQRKVIDQNIIDVVERPTDANICMWEAPVSLVLISLSYWENYIGGDVTFGSFNIPFLGWKKKIHTVRQRTYILTAAWKACWTVIFASLLVPGFSFTLRFLEVVSVNNSSVTQNEHGTPLLSGSLMRHDTLSRGSSDYKSMGVNVFGIADQQLFQVTNELQTEVFNSSKKSIYNSSSDSYSNWTFLKPYAPLIAQVFSGACLCYFGGLACRLCMQAAGFALPLCVATPVALGIILGQCYDGFLSSEFFVWICPENRPGSLRIELLWLIVVYLSQIVITSHIWFPLAGRMTNIDRLFITPMRCSILTDQSMALRRRRTDHDPSISIRSTSEHESECADSVCQEATNIVPTIYACATMWHETKSEMTHLVKSLFRMDIDHSARYLAQKFYKIKDPDYYEFEAHIFFDDSMELSDDDRLVPNSYVCELIECTDDALSSVHERAMTLGPPVRTPTPYGGRLTWNLPGGTRLIVHMKDKHKIRHKKRWSQVMYMYYLLGYKVLGQAENLIQREMSRPGSAYSNNDSVHLSSQLRHRRQTAHFNRSVIFNYVSDDVHIQSENTYILTLDGDVDFKPDAVRLLVDKLKKNKKVGAACGRIHPVGSGPIVWYQEFEYAIGHWLQKATEHVFGCVLCAPGCFSLFRGSALMDDNVARAYAIRATEAGHFVQYDQGEDRWLSTLLLQQGYRIDYCAASDALTHSPETFSEFFNQRRRWGPSTLANCMDLLREWKSTVRVNDNISTLYMLYQFLLLMSTVLGPATVMLMMAGAFTVVFQTSVIESYAIAIIPAILFIVICILTKSETQITIASTLSACYAIVMTIVLVGTVSKGIEGNLTSPNVIFLLMLIVIFFIAAVLHPEEFFCIVHGALYFICIPTGYLFLTIYYLCNLHNVSWGTREVLKRKTKEQIEAEKYAEEEKRLEKEQRQGFFGWLAHCSIVNDITDVFKMLKTSAAKESKKRTTDELLEELIIELRLSNGHKDPLVRTNSMMTQDNMAEIVETPAQSSNREDKPVDSPIAKPTWLKKEDPNNPGWLQDSTCGNGPMKQLDSREQLFWKQFIKKYLYPINDCHMHKLKLTADLKNLRNNVVFCFFMASAIWIALSMQLEILQEDLKDKFFFSIPHIIPQKDDLALEPLGLVFLVFFACILCLQLVGMLAHRWGTILHVLSITELSCNKQLNEEKQIKDMILQAMELQRVSNIENEPEPDYDEPIPDYDDLNEDEDDTTIFYTESELSAESPSLPSYHSRDIPKVAKGKNVTQKQKQIFSKQGHSTGHTLHRAFERRYRYNLQRQKIIDIV